MDEAITKWLEAIANEELNPEDVERSLRYAKDLEPRRKAPRPTASYAPSPRA